jgi:hypothetical protein
VLQGRWVRQQLLLLLMFLQLHLLLPQDQVVVMLM